MLIRLLGLDLQHFSNEFEGGGGGSDVVRGGYNPEAEIEYPTIPNPLNEEPEFVQPEQQPELTQPEFVQTEQQPEFVQPEPVQPNPNEQYMQQLIQENQRMQQQMQQFMAQQQQQMAPPEPQLSPEEQNERLMEKFYDNPSEFFNEMKQQAIEEARKDFEPYIQERKIEQEVQTLSQKYGQDFIDRVPHMQQMVTELGDAQVEKIGLERIYMMAKGAAPVQQQQQPQLTPDQIFQDQNFINEYIAKNPAVQQAVMNQYMANKQQQAPPKVMGTQFGSQPSLAPEQRPKSIGEASRLLRKSWGL